MSEFNWIAGQRFTCKPPSGTAFEVTVRIGGPEADPSKLNGGERCRVGLEPLANDRWVAASNGFQALCLGLDYIRRVFKLFVAEGGRVYWEDTQEVADLDSPWFAPMLDRDRVGLRLGNVVPPGAGG